MILRIGNQKAYFLLELMVAIAILSIGLVFIIQGFSTSVKSLAFSQKLNKACIVADNFFSLLEEEGRIPNLNKNQLDWDCRIKKINEEGTLSEVILKIFSKNKEIIQIVTILRKK